MTLPILPGNCPIPMLRAPETYDVAYPSGRRFTIAGTLVVLRLSTRYAAPMVLTPDGRAIFLDPRGAVSRHGVMVYNPRDYLDDLDPGLVAWLQEHPAWPAELEWSHAP
jgi:hypothetical protein